LIRELSGIWGSTGFCLSIAVPPDQFAVLVIIIFPYFITNYYTPRFDQKIRSTINDSFDLPEKSGGELVSDKAGTYFFELVSKLFIVKAKEGTGK
jgi:hypothetical protein